MLQSENVKKIDNRAIITFNNNYWKTNVPCRQKTRVANHLHNTEIRKPFAQVSSERPKLFYESCHIGGFQKTAIIICLIFHFINDFITTLYLY